ncbi:MAG TPA: thiol:disulfide interchange protein DsbA/DsbL [Albitalea sp.]|uniref:thiol:disulfide interchange protein DsbA/DsbL n=1 Tax=Piscinibacter sp. TaxID=1903157 RepID=UPI002ED03729
MNRREFSAQLLAGGLSATGLAATAHAQGAPVEGTHYVKLAQPVPATPGKIEVIEFFWYGCPHCNAFEPHLDAWARKLPPDVAFRRVPIAFRDEPYTAHQKIFFALDAMGLIPSMHRKVFYAIHNERQRLDKAPDIAAFMTKNGVDSAKFMDNFNSFSTQTKVRQALKLAADYKIDGVPALGIQGKYFTSNSLAGSGEGSLAVADYLIQRERKQ